MCASRATRRASASLNVTGARLLALFSLTACPPKRRTRERPAQSRKESSRDCAGTSAELGVFCDGQDKTVTLGELRRTSAEAKADEPNTSAEL
jgi:hypothetical protein